MYRTDTLNQAYMRTWGLLAAGVQGSLGLALPHLRVSTRITTSFVGKVAMTTDHHQQQHMQVRSPESSYAYAYCHGFLSGPASFKGQALRKRLLERGVDLALLNLNGKNNDLGAITCSGALDAIRQFHLETKRASGNPGLKLRLAGSSLGGFLVARYAELYPEDVDRIFMLCPSFCLGRRAPTFVSEAEMSEWERTGVRVFPVSTGGEANVRWAFVEDAKLQPDYPNYLCPAAIVHGLSDQVVPSATTRSLVEGSSDLAKRTSATFVEDDHALVAPATMTVMTQAMFDFFHVEGPAERTTGADELPSGGGNEDVPPSSRDVEVEAKFSAEDIDQIKESVLTSGGEFVGEQVFTDVYWDARECGLTERDWWLRSRAGRWELKVPAGERRESEGVTAYREVTSISEIAKELEAAGFLGASEAGSLPQLGGSALSAAGFEVFASFRTNRSKYRLGEHFIDIDRASFGHQLVEIETMFGPDKADITVAGERIVAVAQALGIRREGESGRPVKGKLTEYIMAHCPRQLEVLTRRRAVRSYDAASETSAS